MNATNVKRVQRLVVAALVAGIIATALAYYTQLVAVARLESFKAISSHFATGAANVRVQWLVHRSLLGPATVTDSGKVTDSAKVTESGKVTLDGREYFVSAQGWPASIGAPVSEGLTPSLSDCANLWRALLENPPELVGASGDEGIAAGVSGHRCRYQLISAGLAVAEFDYDTANGNVSLNELAAN